MEVPWSQSSDPASPAADAATATADGGETACQARRDAARRPGPNALHTVFRDRKDQMPREKLANFGPAALSDAELLAVFLRTGRPGLNVMQLAAAILDRYRGDLRRLSAESHQALAKIHGIGQVHALELVAMFEFARRAALRPCETRPKVTTPEDVARILAPLVMLANVETFYALPLDKKFRLVGGVRAERMAVFTGTADATFVHPRDVYREAVRADACYLMVAHNHPSGDCTPSPQDIRLTQALIDAGRVMRIPLVDHVVLGGFPPGADDYENAIPRFHSMRDCGDLDF